MGFFPRTRRGERAPNAKLTKALIAEAKRLAEEEDYTLPQIKSRLELDCSTETIRKAIRGESYRE
jgi:hypothetical protein